MTRGSPTVSHGDVRMLLAACLSLVFAAGAAAQDEPLGEVPPPPPPDAPSTQGVPPPPHPPSPPPPASSTPPPNPPPASWAPSPAAAPGSAPYGPVPVAAPTQSDRRAGLEIAELHVGAFGFGMITSMFALSVLGAEDLSLYASIPILGGMAGIAGVLALDSGAGMRSGVPSAITAGMLVGLLDGLLIWGAVEADYRASEVLGLVVAGTGIGTAVGALLGYGTRPTVAENRLVLTLAGWGAWLGALTEVALDGTFDRSTARGALVGANVGLALALLVGAAGDISMETVALMNGGALALSIVAVLILGPLTRSKDVSGEAAALTLLIGGGLGLAAGAFTAGASDEDGDQSTDAAPSISAAPIPGGAYVGATWPL